MFSRKSQLRRLLLTLALAPFFLTACATQKPTLLKYSLWSDAQQVPGNLHLILIWSDEFAKKSGRPAAHPVRLVEALIAECAKTGAGRIVSWQILESPVDIEPWLAAFRPATPILKVNAKLESTESSGSWAISIEGRSRIQALPFDTATNDTKTSVQVSRKPQPPQPTGDSFARELLKTSENRLVADFAQKLFAQLPAREKQETVLGYQSGKSERMKQAHAAALAGNFSEAAKLWSDEERENAEDYKASGNLSAYYETQGDLKKALEHHKIYVERQPKGFRSLLLAEYNQEREAMLKGLLALKETPLDPRIALTSSATIAILPLSNGTNDLDAPVKIRRHLAEQAKKLGMSVMPLETIDEKLKKAGFTDAGQFRSTTVQKLGKDVGADYLLMGDVDEFRILPDKEVKVLLKLVFAPAEKTIYEKDVRVLDESKNFLNTMFEKALAKAAEAITEKATGKTLDLESELAARRYMQAWPHFTAR